MNSTIIIQQTVPNFNIVLGKKIDVIGVRNPSYTSTMYRNRLGSHKIRGLIELLQLYRAKTNNINALANSAVSATSRRRIGDNNGPFVKSSGARFVHDDSPSPATTSSRTMMVGHGKPTPPPQPPSPTPRPPPASRVPWIKIVLGSMFSLLLAFWAPKWTTFLKIAGEAEVVLKEVDQVAEAVEKVANTVEKMSEEAANKLPDDNKLKETILVVEHISEEAAKDAHIVDEIIHKVEEVEQDIEDVGETIEPIIEKVIVHDQKSSKGVKHQFVANANERLDYKG